MALISVHRAVRALLVNDGTFVGLCSTRAYPGSAPERPTFPLVVLERAGTDFHHNLDGPATLRGVEQRVVVYSDSFAEVEQVAGAVLSVLDGYEGTVTVGADTLVIDSVFADDEEDETLDVENEEGNAGVLYARTLAFRVNHYTNEG